MRRRLLALSGLGLAALAALLALASPAGPAAAQAQPSPRPPLSATDQYLTAIAPAPTQPASGGGGAPAASAQPAATATPGQPRATRTPAPSATPVLIVQTVVQTVSVVQTVEVIQTVSVVQTVVVVATQAAAPATATPTSTATLEPVGAGPLAPGAPGPWVWFVIALPILALVVALGWLLRREFLFPGIYPAASRPRRIKRLPGRKASDGPRLPE